MTVQLILLSLETVNVTAQAERVAEQLGLPHISMSQLSSEAMRDRFSPELQALQPYDPVASPDLERLAILEVRLRQRDARQGWILSGFPTSVTQAQALHRLLEDLGYPQPQALYLNWSRSIIQELLAQDSPHPDQQLETNLKQISLVVEYYQELGCLNMVNGDAPISLTHSLTKACYV